MQSCVLRNQTKWRLSSYYLTNAHYHEKFDHTTHVATITQNRFWLAMVAIL